MIYPILAIKQRNVYRVMCVNIMQYIIKYKYHSVKIAKRAYGFYKFIYFTN